MASLEPVGQGEAKTQSKIEHCSEDIRKASAHLSELTNQCRIFADNIAGGDVEKEQVPNPRECRAGQIGSLQDSCDQLHRRVDSLTEQINRLQTGLGI